MMQNYTNILAISIKYKSQSFMSDEILAVIVIVLMLILGTYQTTIAEKNKDIKNSSDSTTTTTTKTMTIPLPFNSHIAYQANNEKTYLRDSLLFP
jgi:nitrate reductase gamma subunit